MRKVFDKKSVEIKLGDKVIYEGNEYLVEEFEGELAINDPVCCRFLKDISFTQLEIVTKRILNHLIDKKGLEIKRGDTVIYKGKKYEVDNLMSGLAIFLGSSWMHIANISYTDLELVEPEKDTRSLADEEHDEVNNPKHYDLFPDGTQSMDIIQAALSREEFIGFLKGNCLKYRIRAGKKGDLQQDIDKANWYENKLREVFDNA